MRVLLDTHVLLWWIADDRALSASARATIANPENLIFVSAVSLWEIRIKESIGKIDLPRGFEAIVEQQQFEPMPMTWAHAHEVGRLPRHHGDPFDRMLIAQARVEGLALVSSDRALRKYEVKLMPA